MFLSNIRGVSDYPDYTDYVMVVTRQAGLSIKETLSLYSLRGMLKNINKIIQLLHPKMENEKQ